MPIANAVKNPSQTERKYSNTQIVHGGTQNGDFSLVRRLAKDGKTYLWGCGKETKAGDSLLIYFLQPHSKIIASATALDHARPGDYWPFITKIGNVKLLSSPISLDEMREMFPRWKWLNYPRAKQYLDDEKSQRLLERASLTIKMPPVCVRISGAGFGTPERNRLVEQAACRAVRRHFTMKGYKVVSRESEKLGYDFEASRKGTILHIEVKGLSGSLLRFPITANEVECARSDSSFRLAIVTEATTPQKKLHLFSGTEFLRQFGLAPLAYFAEAQNEFDA